MQQEEEAGNSTEQPPPYFIPRRPRVVRMRDLSPSDRARLTRDYFAAYDPWTGIRVAATLGALIALFALFLAYKSRFQRARAAAPSPKAPPALYLYGPDSPDSGAYGVAFACRRPDAAYQLEEVFVKSSMVALKVHPPKRQSKSGPKFGTLRITEDAPRSLPCSPYKQQATPTSSSSQRETTPASSASIASFVGEEEEDVDAPPTTMEDESSEGGRRKKRGRGLGGGGPKSTVVTAKRPQDYRSRSTIVSIARRQRMS